MTRLVHRPVLGLVLLLAASACGGSSDGSCAGYITINATPEQCAAIAEKYGCTSYEVKGPSCGLTACVTCTDI